MELREFIEFVDLDWDNIIVDPDSGINLSYQFDIMPEDFITFAEKDIQNENVRGLVNALSNAKRAIDSQVDKVLACFNILQEIGLVAPQIIRKVIRKRNYLEHEYKIPERDKVKDAIDIASLFIDSSERILHLFWDCYTLGNEKDMFDKNMRFKHCIYCIFDSEKKVWNLRGYNNDKKEEIIIDSKNKLYQILIKLSVAISKEKNIDKIIKEFIDVV
ncbi:MAG: hypothetical protein ACE5K0_03525 [Candidatus Methanofastidiosia archaeon]